MSYFGSAHFGTGHFASGYWRGVSDVTPPIPEPEIVLGGGGLFREPRTILDDDNVIMSIITQFLSEIDHDI